MVCPECGAHLESSDQFCPGCGVRIIRKKRCPECGEMLREGTRFCPGCGEEIPEDYFTRKKSSAGSAPKKKANAAPPPKKRPVREREREDDWDDEEDEESVDVLTIMTVAVGCILLVIIAVLGFNLFQRYMPKNYDKAARQQEQEEEGEETEGEEADGEGGQLLTENNDEEPGTEVSADGGTLVTTADVNIRDNPSTEGTNVIKKAKKGESYTYTEAVEGGTWYKILLSDGDEYGYVYAEYVELQ